MCGNLWYSLPSQMFGHFCNKKLKLKLKNKELSTLTEPQTRLHLFLPSMGIIYLTPIYPSKNQGICLPTGSFHLFYATRKLLGYHGMPVTDFLIYFSHYTLHSVTARTLSFKSVYPESLAQCLEECKPIAAECQMNDASSSSLLSLVTM